MTASGIVPWAITHAGRGPIAAAKPARQHADASPATPPFDLLLGHDRPGTADSTDTPSGRDERAAPAARRFDENGYFATPVRFAPQGEIVEAGGAPEDPVQSEPANGDGRAAATVEGAVGDALPASNADIATSRSHAVAGGNAAVGDDRTPSPVRIDASRHTAIDRGNVSDGEPLATAGPAGETEARPLDAGLEPSNGSSPDTSARLKQAVRGSQQALRNAAVSPTRVQMIAGRTGFQVGVSVPDADPELIAKLRDRITAMLSQHGARAQSIHIRGASLRGRAKRG